MLNFLKNIFVNDKKYDATVENNEDYVVELSKKSKFSTDETSIEKYFYVHKGPKDANKENNMPSYIESADNINTSQVEIIDDKTGRKMMVDAATAQGQMEHIPPGINIPGIGVIGGRQRPPQNQQRQQPQNQQPQQRPQNQQRPQLNEDVGQAPPQRPIPAQIVAQNQAPEVFYPSTEMASVEGAYHIWIDLAGVKKENLKVSYNNSQLIVSGSRISNLDLLDLEGDGNRRTHNKKILQESSTVPHFLLGDFSFSYPFKKQIDETAIQAAFEDGVLHITLPHRIKGDEIAISIM